MLSDEWFAEQFMDIKGRLSSIEEVQKSSQQRHVLDMATVKKRLDKLETYVCEDGEMMEKDWKYYSKKYSPFGAALIMLSYIIWDIYVKMRGG